ncbi:MAG: SDR family oxidoreductase [Candidatus Sericytochromatia bacterium]|nr:SDR family oxidoreductase [Candidatus Sericytochromatia bacterium]
MAKTALVTGASSGIGEAFARALAERGFNLVLLARRGDRLDTLAAELHARSGVNIDVLPCDLTENNAFQQIETHLTQQSLTIDLLVNNAGMGLHGAFETQRAEDDERMIQLNIVALTRMTRCIVPGMVQRQRGTVIFVASTAAFQSIPYFAIYAATKAYVLSFAQALALEVGPKGILVQCLCPGPTRSEFSNHAKFQSDTITRAPQQTAEQVVSESLAAVERRAHVVVTGSINRWGTLFSSLLPRSMAARISGLLFTPRQN